LYVFCLTSDRRGSSEQNRWMVVCIFLFHISPGKWTHEGRRCCWHVVTRKRSAEQSRVKTTWIFLSFVYLRLQTKLLVHEDLGY
jgi:hypothetical protein